MNQQGFSLIEVLIASLLLSTGMILLYQYHAQLMGGLEISWQQRAVWQQASQQLITPHPSSFTVIPQQTPFSPGCYWQEVTVISLLNRQANLRRLRCERG